MKRSLRCIVPAIALAMVAGSVARSLHAEGSAAEDKDDRRLVLEIGGEWGFEGIPGIDAEALRAAIGAELAVKVSLAGPGVSGKGTITVRAVGAMEVRVTFHATGGKSVERTLELPKDPKIAVETIALLVANLVRDEASGLVAELKAKVTVEIGTGAPPPAAPKSEPAPMAKSEAGPKVSPKSGPCGAPISGPWWGVDFVPGLGSSFAPEGRHAVRLVSFNVIGGMARGLRGGEVAGVFNVESETVCGGQVAGVTNLVLGSVSGLQIAGVLNWAKGPLYGAQIGTVNVAASVSGAQVGTVDVSGGSVKGTQIGTVNVAGGDVSGAQIGVVNVAEGKTTFQVGVVNVASDGEAIGLVNVFTHGRTSVDAWVTDTGIGMIGLAHGGRVLHNIYGIGARTGPKGDRLASTFGIGGRILRDGGFAMDLDLLGTLLYRQGISDQLFTSIGQLRLAFTVPLFSRLALFGGPTYSVMTTNDPEEAPPSFVPSTRLGKGGATSVRGWPGLSLGLRAFDW